MGNMPKLNGHERCGDGACHGREREERQDGPVLRAIGGACQVIGGCLAMLCMASMLLVMACVVLWLVVQLREIAMMWR